MINPLAAFPTSGRESQAIDDVVEALFKKDDQIFTGIATFLFSSRVDQFELFLQYSINEAEFLFLNKLARVFTLFAPSFGCLSSDTWFMGIAKYQGIYSEIIASLEDRSS